MRIQQFVRSRMVWQRAPGLTVPVTAVVRVSGKYFCYTSKVAASAEQILMKDPDILALFSVMGFSFSGAAPNQGIMFVRLKEFKDRPGDARALSAVLRRVSGPLFGIPGAIVVAFTPPSIPGLSRFGGFEFQVGARPGKRRLLPGRPGHADRPGGQERDPDRRIRGTVAGKGVINRRRGGRGRPDPAAPHPHDVPGLHPRGAPARVRDGAGQEARHSVGTAVAGGMLVSTILNVVFIPVLYVVVETLRGVRAEAWPRPRMRPDQKPCNS